jgi:hypothetical protein
VIPWSHGSARFKEYFSRNGAKAQSAAAFLRVCFSGKVRLKKYRKETGMAIPALFWRTLTLTGEAIESDNDIWNVIKATMKEIGLSDIKKNPSDVNGHTQDTIVATTFVKLGNKSYMLFIMAAGDHAKGLRDQLHNKLSKIKFL